MTFVIWPSAIPDSAKEGKVGSIRMGRSHTVCSVFNWKGPCGSFNKIYKTKLNVDKNKYIEYYNL